MSSARKKNNGLPRSEKDKLMKSSGRKEWNCCTTVPTPVTNSSQMHKKLKRYAPSSPVSPSTILQP